MAKELTSGTSVRGTDCISSSTVITRESLFRVRDTDEDESASPAVPAMMESGQTTNVTHRYSFSHGNDDSADGALPT